MKTQKYVDLVQGWISDRDVAGLQFTTGFESLIGETVTPPAGTMQAGGRVVQGEFTLPDGRVAVTIDSWGSQASRMEAAVEAVAEDIGYPLVRFVDEDGGLLTTSVRLSHRQADATWRAARVQLEEAGIPFQEIQQATTSNAGALVRWFPTSPIFGWWHSHTVSQKKLDRNTKVFGKELADAFEGYAKVHSDARSARIVTAEIVATGVARRHRMAAKQDTLFGPQAKQGGSKDEVGPSALGLGSMPPTAIEKAPVDVTYESIVGHWFLSFSGLRRFGWADQDAADANALMVALALLLREVAAQDARLRAGTELRIVNAPKATLVRHAVDAEEVSLPSGEELVALVRELGSRAGWEGPVTVTIPPKSILGQLLEKSDRELVEADGGA
ncbi:CRISPR-associated protein Csb1 [Barrientosiimonas humi]|uniref:CRISPR-associated protein Csb1 n=1 Tax=Barrientosiimonas humi TaxID=999931 RepID=A0A542XG01_9MICO|nr:type I-U CRISPR-associated RAMP protein Csb1/Cas7u [Barrientosiimonas humi]TQL34747.1 CRISPR-associated protein Csb1 [Barrientosiimonas humi]CAG7570807.1 hypothetical protein BH39T_PBIAJDOK_00045 [Barrientosiimonas humi]